MNVAKPRPYIIQIRVGLTADSDVHADHTADHLQARLEETLEDDDTVRVTQVALAGEPLVQEEVLTRLRLGRNELARLPYKNTMNLAQEVDKIIWMLIKRADDDDALPNDYDYNRIVNITKALRRGENPLY
jgi:hypothetical protein